jgi:hypothetical protein
MLKAGRSWLFGLTISLVTFIATPAFAKSINFKDAGIALWIFIIIGAVIVLLQLIPAIILFFSFIGTSSGMVFKRKKAMEELTAEEKGKVLIPGYEPEPVKK